LADSIEGGRQASGLGRRKRSASLRPIGIPFVHQDKAVRIFVGDNPIDCGLIAAAVAAASADSEPV